MTRSIAAFVALISVVAIIVVIFRLQPTSKNGLTGEIPTASAACIEKSPNCLPTIPLLDDNGQTWDASNLKDKVVILNVWATWCVPCQQEIPAFAKFYEKHKDEVVMLGLLSEYGVNKQQLEAFREKYEMNYPVVFLEPEVREALGNPSGLPSTFFYDRNGHLSYLHKGGLSLADLEEQSQKLLGN